MSATEHGLHGKILSSLDALKKGQARLLRLHEVGKSNISVAKAAELCVAAKFAKNIRKESLDAFRKSLKSLCASIGEKSIQSVQPGDVAAWLAAHPDWQPKTRLNNLKYANSLFAWLVGEWKLKRNPCDGVPRPIVPFKKIVILTVDQIERLLVAAQASDPALLGYIAPVLFGGLRPTESKRCGPETFNFNPEKDFPYGMIDLGGEACKLKDRRCSKISAALRAWLAVDGVVIGPQKNLAARMAALARSSGVPLSKNVLRHCFCSYMLPLHGLDETARMANNSRDKLNTHYLAMVTLEDAKRFETLRPAGGATPNDPS